MFRVLLPIDESESRAREQAERIAELPDAANAVTVDVVHVHGASGPEAPTSPSGSFDPNSAAVQEDVTDLESLPDSIETATDLLDAEGVEYAVHEARGDPAEVIVSLAEKYESDRIVIGARSQSPVGKVLFGSVAQAVILDSDRPVTTVVVS
ncbi:universal stress protein [Halobiforma nitratireducens]|uniref:UspA domain-containing protein n=1 Tax=Halobiforma nitratireducens JCM 10879 TaxID=1227454 RepID=M0MC52_9EURY|nr:universal stress protein [Halobiforma nitratireducens]EMA42913.1 UspA domain-containing protein [Halobiforma nitratireducens JCM 10879]